MFFRGRSPFIADKDGRAEQLFDWIFSGDSSEQSDGVLRDALESVGAIVGGRIYFDQADGWGGEPPMGVPAFIVTHRPPPADWPADNDRIVFVHDGVGSAIAQAKAAAGDKTVALATPTVTRAAHAAGLLDAVSVHIVPILLGERIPWLAGIPGAPVALEDPKLVPGHGVTHLTYRVVKER